MAQRVIVAGRTTGVLTGTSVNYGADLDMNLTADGCVTVHCTGTKGNCDALVLQGASGPAATPTGLMKTDLETNAEAGPWVRAITFRTNERYFRAAVECTGAGDGTGSDAVINYSYIPKCANSGA
jgi:hypothetical protein